MSLQDTLQALNQMIPVLATLTGHPQVGALARQLIDLANHQLESQAAASGKTTEQILQDAGAMWDAALQNAMALRDMGGDDFFPDPPMMGGHGPGDEP